MIKKFTSLAVIVVLAIIALFDDTKTCTSIGCIVEDVNVDNWGGGYWTQDSVFNDSSSVWNVTYAGEIYNNRVDNQATVYA